MGQLDFFFFHFRPRKKCLKTFRQHQLQKAAEIFKYLKVSFKIALEEKKIILWRWCDFQSQLINHS